MLYRFTLERSRSSLSWHRVQACHFHSFHNFVRSRFERITHLLNLLILFIGQLLQSFIVSFISIVGTCRMFLQLNQKGEYMYGKKKGFLGFPRKSYVDVMLVHLYVRCDPIKNPNVTNDCRDSTDKQLEARKWWTWL